MMRDYFNYSIKQLLKFFAFLNVVLLLVVIVGLLLHSMAPVTQNYGTYLTNNTINNISNIFEGTLNKTEQEASVQRKSPEFYIITMLSVFHGTRWPKYSKFSVQDLNQRDDEYLETLRSNINQEFVKEMHLHYLEDEALKMVEKRNFTNKHKIVPVKRDRRLHMANFFIYASENLIDKAVIAMNGDIMLGEGFELINTERLRDEKVLYSLTRHGANPKCRVLNGCLGHPYQGSHDTHIFRLRSPLNKTILLDKLDYPINMWQAENGMLWTLKNMFNFKVRNPCRVLKTYHNHCSKVHGPGTTADNHYSILGLPGKGWTKELFWSAFAGFEDSLVYRNCT